MSTPVDPSLTSSDTQAAAKPDTQVSATGTTNQAAAAQSYDVNTQIKSLEDLKAKAPEVWKKILEGIATTIIGRMRDAEARRRQIARDNQK